MQKTPPLLLAAALLFWGWQSQHIILAILMAVVLEGARFIPFRWDLTRSELKGVWIVCFLIFGGFIFYLAGSGKLISLILLRFNTAAQVTDQWAPVIFFPLMFSQVYSSKGTLDLRAFSFRLRGRRSAYQPYPLPFNFAYPYALLCVLTFDLGADVRGNWLYLGAVALILWLFFSFRSRRYSPAIWLATLAIAGIVGYVNFMYLFRLNPIRLLTRGIFVGGSAVSQHQDPYRSITAVGDIGAIKLLNTVLFRVRADSPAHLWLLLREASYNRYQASNWYARPRDQFVTVPPEADETSWNIPSEAQSPSGSGNAGLSSEPQQVSVSCYLQDKKAILKLPTATFRVESLPVGVMTQNPFGAVQVEEGPNLITYHALFQPSGWQDSPPNEDDFSLPDIEQPMLQQLAEELQLSADTPEQAVEQVSTFFLHHFSYSLDLERQATETPPLTDFLLHTRSGHCEYFATATVLLLRAAGIPARYAVGFAVEHLDTGKWRLVRARDAHAWALVYLNGAWHNLDTTPPSWREIEQANAFPLEGLTDLWYRARFAFSAWRWRDRPEDSPQYIGLLLIPLLLILAWRLYTQRRIRRIKKKPGVSEETRLYPGMDSPFYLIEQILQKQGFSRNPGESLSYWLQRIDRMSPVISFRTLQPLLVLHYRYRFDPDGLSSQEQAELRQAVQMWVAQHGK